MADKIPSRRTILGAHRVSVLKEVLVQAALVVGNQKLPIDYRLAWKDLRSWLRRETAPEDKAVRGR